MADTWGTGGDASTAQGNSWESNGNKHDDHEVKQVTDNDEANDTPREVIDPKAGNEEFAQAVRSAGWTEPTAFDYEAFEAHGADTGGWEGAAARYEWNEEYGEVAPRVPALEEMLFAGDRTRRGTDFEALTEFVVDVQGPSKLPPVREFIEAGLHPVMLENLDLCGYTHPTPIQAYCIPYALQNHDMVAIAQTGSGKTAAYMVPVISKLMGKAKRLCGPKPDTTKPGFNPRLHKVKAEPLVVIVVPARELAIQIFDEARRLCYRSMLRPCVIYGGLPYGVMVDDLGKGCDLLIATPGRLKDLMDKPAILSMRRVKYTILDEADELLHDDWQDELKAIMQGGDMNTDADNTFMLFSATFPPNAVALADEHLADNYYKINIGRAGSTHRNVKQDVIWVDGDKKIDALWALIMSMERCRILIFCNSRRAVDMVDDVLYNRSLPTTSIHGGRNQREREDALRAFRSGKVPILIATGVSSRGWDIPGINHVINFDLPDTTYGGIAEYVHRIGRTARIGNKGTATSFYNERNEDLGKALTNVLLESGSEVPDFLQQFVHEDGQAHFEEDDGNGDMEDGSPAWGAEGSSAEAEEPEAGDNEQKAETEHDTGTPLVQAFQAVSF